MHVRVRAVSLSQISENIQPPYVRKCVCVYVTFLTSQQWAEERESIQREYDQMEQEYNLQCSELNAARERISLLLQQLERCENVVSITQETGQKEKDVLKHKVKFYLYTYMTSLLTSLFHYQIAVQEGEIQRLLAKLDYVITTPNGGDKGGTESAVVRCEKVWSINVCMIYLSVCGRRVCAVLRLNESLR